MVIFIKYFEMEALNKGDAENILVGEYPCNLDGWSGNP